MAAPPKKPRSQHLVDEFVKNGDLSEAQMQEAMDELKHRAEEINRTSANLAAENLRPEELVTWVAPPCSDNKPVRINGQRYLGPMTKPAHVFHQWLTIWQADWIAKMDFFKARGGMFVNDRYRPNIPLFNPPRVDVRRAG